MKLSQVQQILEAQLWTGGERLESKVYAACGCDLMSDVLAFAKEKVLLLTGLINLQVIRTAEMLDIKAIVFVRGKKPSQDMIDLANERGIVLFSTDIPLYPACGLLYEAGLRG
ncbi:MAG: hypothetical protein J6F30_16135 [Cellulosilyticum sp.]|nr:hypothetical protein [Cellulosilyticum sp.]